MSKKPPDDYKCIKLPLNKIMNQEHIHILDNAVLRTHKIVIKAYQLLRLWILDNYEKSKFIPNINKDTFCTAIRVIKLKQNKNNNTII